MLPTSFVVFFPWLCPHQVEAVSWLILDKTSQSCRGLCRHWQITGSLSGVSGRVEGEEGRVGVLVPLLLLMTAQLTKLHATVHQFNTINAVHVDELSLEGMIGMLPCRQLELTLSKLHQFLCGYLKHSLSLR